LPYVGGRRMGCRCPPVVFDESDHGRQTGFDGEHFDHPASAFGTGVLEQAQVACLSREQQLTFHDGYEPRPVDLHDLELLRGPSGKARS